MSRSSGTRSWPRLPRHGLTRVKAGSRHAVCAGAVAERQTRVEKRVPEARTVSRSDGAARGRRHQDAQSAIAASVEAERESATSVQPGENPIPPVDTAPPHEEGALASVVAGDRESTQTSSEHPVVTLMGEAVLTRLRDRYAALQARIDREVSEVAEQESIRARSEALNPDYWVGLEAALKGIRAIRGRRSRGRTTA